MNAVTRFDDLAATYEAWFDTPLGRYVARSEKELILGLLRPTYADVILEVGSGTGYFLRELAGSGARCIGIEPSVEMLAVAVSRSGGIIDYVRGRGEALPFESGAFDALLFMTTLEFAQDVEAAVREAARVTRPGGHLVCGVLNEDGPWARARRREGGLWNEARFFRAAELAALLSPLGAVRVSFCVHVPPQFSRLPGPCLSLMDGLLRRLFPASGALIGAHVTLGRQ